MHAKARLGVGRATTLLASRPIGLDRFRLMGGSHLSHARKPAGLGWHFLKLPKSPGPVHDQVNF